jgi:Glycosyltransferase family 10 (fucosyltransferase) C-term
MIVVRIVKNYHYPDLFRQTPLNKGIWDDIMFTESDITECDYLVVLNSSPIDLNIKNNVGGSWLFSQESPLKHYEWHTQTFKYFDRVYTFWDKPLFKNICNEQTSLPWHINKDYDFLKSLSCAYEDKLDKISWVTSNLNFKPGHKLRIAFLNALVESEFEFDLFGRGFNPIEDKFEALYPYKYSIAVENYACQGYWTEKIADCYLSWTMPIYYGCKDILDYFPENSLILIDPKKPKESIQIIKTAIQNNHWKKNIDSIAEARNLILDKYQLFPNIVDKISKHRQGIIGDVIKKDIFIPQNIAIKKSSKLSKLKGIIKSLIKS